MKLLRLESLESRKLLSANPTTPLDLQSETLIVNTTSDFVDANDEFLSLHEAIAYAAASDTITFDSSLNGKTITLAGTELTISKGITIDASSLADGIIIDANQNSRVFDIFGGTEETPVQLKNLTVTGGADGCGGGILNEGMLTLTNCSIIGNSSDRAGGIMNIWTATLSLTNCSVTGNSVSNYDGGGGIENDQGTLILTNCTISGNYGGGIYNNRYGELTLTNCTVAGNSVSNYGGGIYNALEGKLTLTNCSVAGNSASYGGGIYNEGKLILTNCSVAGNSASYGGGIYNNYYCYNSVSVVTLKNSIVTLNTATSSGNDFYQNTHYGETGTIQGYNNLSSFTAWGGTSGNNYVYDSNKPLFTDAENGDYTLAANSQAINKGNNAYAVYPDGTAIEFDLAGKQRICNGIVDLGAYEYQYKETPSVVVTTNRDVVDSTDGVISLREAIAQAASGETVTFAASLAGKTIVLNGSQLVVDKGITIYTSALAAGITIDAGGKSSVLSVSGGTENSPVTLVNLTLTGGKTAWYGGLLYAKDVVSVQNCKFNAGFAYYGGAIANEGTLTVDKCEFNGNQGAQGAAIFNRSTGSVTVNDSDFSENSVTNYGGAIYNNGTATVADSVFNDNTSNNRAGAIYVAQGTVSCDYCSFSGNTAKNTGGAIYNAGNLALSNGYIENGSSIYGGAISNFKSLTLNAFSFYDNVATTQGGAIYHSSSITLDATGGFFNGNSANNGGAIYLRIGTAQLNGIELTSNIAKVNGGAIFSCNQTILTDCVVSGNNAAYYGGGVYNEKIVRVRGTTSVSDNATGTGKSQDFHTRSGGQIIYDSPLADSVFDEEDDWLIEL